MMGLPKSHRYSINGLLVISEDEILKTLNCGIGLIVIVDPSNAKNISSYLNKINENHFVIGEITNNKKNNSGITYKRD